MEIIYDDLMGSYAVVLEDDRVLLLGAETYEDAEQEVELMIELGEHHLYS